MKEGMLKRARVYEALAKAYQEQGEMVLASKNLRLRDHYIEMSKR